MLVALYASLFVLVLPGLSTTIWISFLLGSVLALLLGFAWVTK